MKKKKTKKDFEKWMKEVVSYYSPHLGIELTNIGYKHDEYAQGDYVAINCVYPYHDTTIKYKNTAFEDWLKGELKKEIILHELCHIITDPFYIKSLQRFTNRDEIEAERERLTDKICLILRKFI